MAIAVQVTIDCADPAKLARFWADALGYRIQDPPEGYGSWEDWLRENNVPEERWNDISAAVDPDGSGPRLFFQRVPEGKQVKNRIHLDLNVGGPRDAPEEERTRNVDEAVERIMALGATKVEDRTQLGERWVVMRDPEGNEFCVQ